MEVFSRSVVLLFLLVFSTLVKGQGIVLDCNGKRTLCVGPLHYLPCMDNGNGRMESVGGLAQICPVGTECSAIGPKSCVPNGGPLPTAAQPIASITTGKTADTSIQTSTMQSMSSTGITKRASENMKNTSPVDIVPTAGTTFMAERVTRHLPKETTSEVHSTDLPASSTSGAADVIPNATDIPPSSSIKTMVETTVYDEAPAKATVVADVPASDAPVKAVISADPTTSSPSEAPLETTVLAGGDVEKIEKITMGVEEPGPTKTVFEQATEQVLDATPETTGAGKKEILAEPTAEMPAEETIVGIQDEMQVSSTSGAADVIPNATDIPPSSSSKTVVETTVYDEAPVKATVVADVPASDAPAEAVISADPTTSSPSEAPLETTVLAGGDVEMIEKVTMGVEEPGPTKTVLEQAKEQVFDATPETTGAGKKEILAEPTAEMPAEETTVGIQDEMPVSSTSGAADVIPNATDIPPSSSSKTMVETTVYDGAPVEATVVADLLASDAPVETVISADPTTISPSEAPLEATVMAGGDVEMIEKITMGAEEPGPTKIALEQTEQVFDATPETTGAGKKEILAEPTAEAPAEMPTTVGIQDEMSASTRFYPTEQFDMAVYGSNSYAATEADTMAEPITEEEAMILAEASAIEASARTASPINILENPGLEKIFSLSSSSITPTKQPYFPNPEYVPDPSFSISSQYGPSISSKPPSATYSPSQTHAIGSQYAPSILSQSPGISQSSSQSHTFTSPYAPSSSYVPGSPYAPTSSYVPSSKIPGSAPFVPVSTYVPSSNLPAGPIYPPSSSYPSNQEYPIYSPSQEPLTPEYRYPPTVDPGVLYNPAETATVGEPFVDTPFANAAAGTALEAEEPSKPPEVMDAPYDTISAVSGIPSTMMAYVQAAPGVSLGAADIKSGVSIGAADITTGFSPALTNPSVKTPMTLPLSSITVAGSEAPPSIMFAPGTTDFPNDFPVQSTADMEPTTYEPTDIPNEFPVQSFADTGFPMFESSTDSPVQSTGDFGAPSYVVESAPSYSPQEAEVFTTDFSIPDPSQSSAVYESPANVADPILDPTQEATIQLPQSTLILAPAESSVISAGPELVQPTVPAMVDYTDVPGSAGELVSQYGETASPNTGGGEFAAMSTPTAVEIQPDQAIGLVETIRPTYSSYPNQPEYQGQAPTIEQTGLQYGSANTPTTGGGESAATSSAPAAEIQPDQAIGLAEPTDPSYSTYPTQPEYQGQVSTVDQIRPQYGEIASPTTGGGDYAATSDLPGAGTGSAEPTGPLYSISPSSIVVAGQSTQPESQSQVQTIEQTAIALEPSEGEVPTIATSTDPTSAAAGVESPATIEVVQQSAIHEGTGVDPNGSELSAGTATGPSEFSTASDLGVSVLDAIYQPTASEMSASTFDAVAAPSSSPSGVSIDAGVSQSSPSVGDAATGGSASYGGVGGSADATSMSGAASGDITGGGSISASFGTIDGTGANIVAGSDPAMPTFSASSGAPDAQGGVGGTGGVAGIGSTATSSSGGSEFATFSGPENTGAPIDVGSVGGAGQPEGGFTSLGGAGSEISLSEPTGGVGSSGSGGLTDSGIIAGTGAPSDVGSILSLDGSTGGSVAEVAADPATAASSDVASGTGGGAPGGISESGGTGGDVTGGVAAASGSGGDAAESVSQSSGTGGVATAGVAASSGSGGDATGSISQSSGTGGETSGVAASSGSGGDATGSISQSSATGGDATGGVAASSGSSGDAVGNVSQGIGTGGDALGGVSESSGTGGTVDIAVGGEVAAGGDATIATGTEGAEGAAVESGTAGEVNAGGVFEAASVNEIAGEAGSAGTVSAIGATGETAGTAGESASAGEASVGVVGTEVSAIDGSTPSVGTTDGASPASSSVADAANNAGPSSVGTTITGGDIISSMVGIVQMGSDISHEEDESSESPQSSSTQSSKPSSDNDDDNVTEENVSVDVSGEIETYTDDDYLSTDSDDVMRRKKHTIDEMIASMNIASSVPTDVVDEVDNAGIANHDSLAQTKRSIPSTSSSDLARQSEFYTQPEPFAGPASPVTTGVEYPYVQPSFIATVASPSIQSSIQPGSFVIAATQGEQTNVQAEAETQDDSADEEEEDHADMQSASEEDDDDVSAQQENQFDGQVQDDSLEADDSGEQFDENDNSDEASQQDDGGQLDASFADVDDHGANSNDEEFGDDGNASSDEGNIGSNEDGVTQQLGQANNDDSAGDDQLAQVDDESNQDDDDDNESDEDAADVLRLAKEVIDAEIRRKEKEEADKLNQEREEKERLEREKEEELERKRKEKQEEEERKEKEKLEAEEKKAREETEKLAQLEMEKNEERIRVQNELRDKEEQLLYEKEIKEQEKLAEEDRKRREKEEEEAKKELELKEKEALKERELELKEQEAREKLLLQEQELKQKEQQQKEQEALKEQELKDKELQKEQELAMKESQKQQELQEKAALMETEHLIKEAELKRKEALKKQELEEKQALKEQELKEKAKLAEPVLIEPLAALNEPELITQLVEPALIEPAAPLNEPELITKLVEPPQIEPAATLNEPELKVKLVEPALIEPAATLNDPELISKEPLQVQEVKDKAALKLLRRIDEKDRKEEERREKEERKEQEKREKEARKEEKRREKEARREQERREKEEREERERKEKEDRKEAERMEKEERKKLKRQAKQEKREREEAREFVKNREKLVKIARKVYRTLRLEPVPDSFQCTVPGHFADQDNCRKYYICSPTIAGIQKAHLECPDYELYDSVTNICSHYRQANCADEKFFKIFQEKQNR